MIMSCLVFPMNCSPGVLRIEISYLAILTGILSSILFYLIFFNLFDSIVLTFKMLLTYMFNSIFFFYWKKPLRTIISPILMAGVSFEISCLKISQKLEKKNESETLFNLSSNQTIFFYYSPIISPILMAGVSIWAFLSEKLSGIGKKIIGNALQSF